MASRIQPSYPAVQPLQQKTFAELFCERFGVSPAQYEDAVLRHCLYRWALTLFPLLRLFGEQYFASDLDFVQGVGRLRRPEDFKPEMDDFLLSPHNSNWLRRRLKLRISSRQLQALVRETMSGPGGEDMTGFTIPPVAPPKAKTDCFWRRAWRYLRRREGESGHPLPGGAPP
jgi:hypothetical protein